ncbi:TIGR03087 family PEP-CTERM/XrtA system glycosyltransferase [Simplicispira psychrophila]|uniref:TIGR03087 family PEP-CTERM/XrtA system glycosyltransferase n=1 Tax=Simplicispira psychrophila TaxID=80882 RepID=UPI000480331E|nr:TIGR03087 family PEP-CTERM/XrtA system glycosyltransferase [Simplicispira psychrophila]
MRNILYLVHRLPYPPNKGDKVRSYHLLRHLLQSHRVFLGTFIDDPEDEQHVPALRALCPDLHIARLQPRVAKVCSLAGLARGGPLTLDYYRCASLHAWVRRIAAQHELQASVVFSSAMAPYAQVLAPQVPMLVDFVDVDSAKWSQYAASHRWPLSWLYRREGRTLLAYERAVAVQAQRSFFVTDQEVALFLRSAPECRTTVQALCNGVDADFFAPDAARPSPFVDPMQPLVFTGAMDYWPNIDAVVWFATEVLPRLLVRWPRLHFYIVGRNPPPPVRALAGAAVTVTGTVADVRPYLQHAAAVVAPLRVARGIQNKILEAMAMERPVVTVPECANAIGANAAQGLLRADTPQAFEQALQALLDTPAQGALLGVAARRHVLEHFSWDAHLGGINACLD